MKINMKMLCLTIATNCFIYSSCGDGKKDNSEEKTPKVVTDSLLTNKEEKIESEVIMKPNKATLLLDISTSMKGYINVSKDPRFSGVISSFLYLPSKIDVRFFDTKEQPSLSIEEFLNKLNNRTITWSSESDLKAMITAMIQRIKNQSDNLCFLVTDGIMSGSNEQIRNSPDRAYSIRYRTVMSNGIKDLFSDNDSTMSALIIRYKSKFNGIYYCYSNDNITLAEKERPFYVIAIGKRQYVKYIENEIQKKGQEEIGKYENILMLGDKLPYEMKISHGTGLKTNSSKKDILVIEKSARDEQVVLTANLNNIPLYMQTAEYMQTNTEFFIKYKNQDKKRLDSKHYNVKVENLEKGAKLIFSLESNMLRGSQLTYRLKYSLPEWISAKSCDDDKSVLTNLSLLDKTFNLKYFIEGFIPLNKNEYVKEQTLSFTK